MERNEKKRVKPTLIYGRAMSGISRNLARSHISKGSCTEMYPSLFPRKEGKNKSQTNLDVGEVSEGLFKEIGKEAS